MANIPKTVILRRKINELERASFACYDVASSGLSLPEYLIRALRHNPFVEDDDETAQLVGVYKDEIAGGEVIFPLAVADRTKEYPCLSGAALWVDEAKRKSNLGMLLPEEMCNCSPCKIAVAGGTSQKALPVYQFLGYECFLMPRYVMLWKSRSLIETRMCSWLARLCSRVVDGCIAVYAALLGVVSSIKLKGIEIKEISSDDAEMLGRVADLIGSDSARFSEVHDERWLRWHLTESFSKNGPLKLFVASKSDEVIGFYMVKSRFHEQASHRGFKNVWIGSVVEWQTKVGHECKLRWLMIHAAIELRAKGMDAVEIPTTDSSLHNFFRQIGWRRVGESNFVIKAGSGSPLYGNVEITNIDNWRLRPAMGDAGLS